MARRKRTNPEAPGVEGAGPPVGDNGLDDNALRTLAFQWRTSYKKALDQKKKADAIFKDVCKGAKSEIGKGAIDLLKDMIALEEPEGEELMRAKLKRQADALRWMALPLGTQVELALAEPEGPSVDLARNEGKRASAENKPAISPYHPGTPQYDAFLAGYQEHQASIVRSMQ